jgi:hypothetical protein
MPYPLPSSTLLAANRMVKQVGALIAYAQPGDVAVGCTVSPTDPVTFATMVRLVDESPWPVEVSVAPFAAAASCAIGVDGTVVPSATNIVATAVDNGAVGVPAHIIPLAQSSAIGVGLLRAKNLSDLLDTAAARANLGFGLVFTISADTVMADVHNGGTLVMSGSHLLTIDDDLPAGFGCAIKGDFTYGGTATVTDVRESGASNPWCALVQTGTDTYDLVGNKA